MQRPPCVAVWTHALAPAAAQLGLLRVADNDAVVMWFGLVFPLTLQKWFII